VGTAQLTRKRPLRNRASHLGRADLARKKSHAPAPGRKSNRGQDAPTSFPPQPALGRAPRTFTTSSARRPPLFTPASATPRRRRTPPPRHRWPPHTFTPELPRLGDPRSAEIPSPRPPSELPRHGASSPELPSRVKPPPRAALPQVRRLRPDLEQGGSSSRRRLTKTGTSPAQEACHAGTSPPAAVSSQRPPPVPRGPPPTPSWAWWRRGGRLLFFIFFRVLCATVRTSL
jgi:hypothetical protein